MRYRRQGRTRAYNARSPVSCKSLRVRAPLYGRSRKQTVFTLFRSDGMGSDFLAHAVKGVRQELYFYSVVVWCIYVKR
jgi:hypothetical protein